MTRNLPILAAAVALVSIAFTLSPLLTSDFAGIREELFDFSFEERTEGEFQLKVFDSFWVITRFPQAFPENLFGNSS